VSRAPDGTLGPLKSTIAIALGCGLALSWRLWTSSRLFPLAPVVDWLPAVPYPLDVLWLLALAGLLAAVAVLPRPRVPILVVLVLAVGLALGDQTRWQPWYYQYLVMLAALGLYAWTPPAAKNGRIALDACRLIIVATYVWSGLQKLNATFVRETWPDIADAVLRLLPDAARAVPPVFVLAIPVVEVAIGVGLVIPPLRRAAVILATVAHLAILTLFVASGENTVVWPWNLAMIAFVWNLFWRQRELPARRIVVPRNLFQVAVLVLFGVLPALSLADHWDAYLSSALYSGNTNQAVVYVSPSVLERLPTSVHPHVWQRSGPLFLDINRWAYGELNVPVYPEPRVYRRVTERVCRYADGSPDIRLRINGRPTPLDGRRSADYYDCQHLR
jgi:hypothetical protein